MRIEGNIFTLSQKLREGTSFLHQVKWVSPNRLPNTLVTSVLAGLFFAVMEFPPFSVYLYEMKILHNFELEPMVYGVILVSLSFLTTVSL